MSLPSHVAPFVSDGRFILNNHPEKGAIMIGKMASEATAKSTAQSLSLHNELITALADLIGPVLLSKARMVEINALLARARA